MFKKAKSGRDAFTFSLRGLTTIASFAAPTAIADDRINKAIDARLAGELEDQPKTTTREIEDFLALYYAHGIIRAA